MATSVASWIVEHFKSDPTRTNQVISFIKQQNPAVVGIYHVEGTAVSAEVADQFPTYTFQIIEGPQTQGFWTLQ